MKFDRIRKELEKEHAKNIKDLQHYINKGFYPTWAEDHRNDPDAGIKAHSTAKKWEAYQAGTLSREQAAEIAFKRAAREEEKHFIKNLDKVQRAEQSEPPVSISIEVEWKRSRTWGYNPTAIVTIRTEHGWQQFTGTASGCGYDKLTAAVGSALNQSAAVLNILYTAKEKAYRKSKAADRDAWRGGYANNCESNRDAIHYGAGYGILPYFEGGTGWSSFAGVFEACGYHVEEHGGSKTFDSFYIEKGGKRK